MENARPRSSVADLLNFSSNVAQNLQLGTIVRQLDGISSPLYDQFRLMQEIREEQLLLKAIRDTVFAIKSESRLIQKKIGSKVVTHLKYWNLHTIAEENFAGYISAFHSFEDKEYTANLLEELEGLRAKSWKLLSAPQKRDVEVILEAKRQIELLVESGMRLKEELRAYQIELRTFNSFHKTYRHFFLPILFFIMIPLAWSVLNTAQFSAPIVLVPLLIYVGFTYWIARIATSASFLDHNALFRFLAVSIFRLRPFWNLWNGLNYFSDSLRKRLTDCNREIVRIENEVIRNTEEISRRLRTKESDNSAQMFPALLDYQPS